MPVEAISELADAGPEWNIESPGLPIDGASEAPALETAPVEGATEKGFGSLLADQISNLQGLQDEAAAQGQALATGTAEDPASVVMAVERAQLSMQLAAQLRDRGVEAFQEIFRTQV